MRKPCAWLIAKIGQSVTSPSAARKGTAAFVETALAKSGNPHANTLGILAGGARYLVSLALYATIGIFAIPYIAASMMATTVGAQIFIGMNAAVTWMGTLPIFGTLGAFFATNLAMVSSMLGIHLTAGLAAASTIAGATFFLVPALDATKTVARKILPAKDTFIEEAAAVQSGDYVKLHGSGKNDNSPGLRPTPANNDQYGNELKASSSSSSSSTHNAASALNTSKIGMQPLPVVGTGYSGVGTDYNSAAKVGLGTLGTNPLVDDVLHHSETGTSSYSTTQSSPSNVYPAIPVKVSQQSVFKQKSDADTVTTEETKRTTYTAPTPRPMGMGK